MSADNVEVSAGDCIGWLNEDNNTWISADHCSAHPCQCSASYDFGTTYDWPVVNLNSTFKCRPYSFSVAMEIEPCMYQSFTLVSGLFCTIQDYTRILQHCVLTVVLVWLLCGQHSCAISVLISTALQQVWCVERRSLTATKEEVNAFARVRFSVCLSVCLLARLLKNACIDLDKMLRVDRCRDMDESGVYLDFLTRGDLRSLRGWPCQRGRSKFKCDTNVHCVNDKQYI